MAKVGRNDPCPCGSGKKHKHCCIDQDQTRLPAPVANTPVEPVFPPPMACGQVESETPRERAIELVARAEMESAWRGMRLVHQALELWPECPDAYLYLAEQERKPERALEQYDKAISLGERLIDSDERAANEGMLYSAVSAQSYLDGKPA